MGDLAETEEGQGGPGKAFESAQAGLADGREGELNLQSADGKDIAVVQDGPFNGGAIDGQERTGFSLAN